MTNRPTRRRLLAISAGLLGTALTPARAWAQGTQPKLPDCEARATSGDWTVVAYESGGKATPQSIHRNVRKLNDSVAYAVFEYKYGAGASGTRPSYELDFALRREPAPTTFDVALTASDGSSARASFSPRLVKSKSGGISTTIDLSAWFREPNNPLKRGSNTITITVAGGGAELFAIEVESNGFAEAAEFVRREQARLEQMEKNKQCEPPCFLTTACCGLIGLDDDCFELRTLRAFRDGPLAAMPGGMEDIAHYYQRAPLILAEIGRRGDSRRLLQLYATHILPSALAARLGLNGLARTLYTGMMDRLERRYIGIRA